MPTASIRAKGSLVAGATALRAVRHDDLAVLTEMRNDVELQLHLMARPRPNSPRQVQEWIDRRSSDTTGAFFVIARMPNDQAVGFTQLQRIDAVNGHAWLGIALSNAGRGSGHGRRALMLLEDYAGRVLDLGKSSKCAPTIGAPEPCTTAPDTGSWERCVSTSAVSTRPMT
jgi:diamine N-acetyltransferase